MAMANVTLTCTECGIEYTIRKKCYNRTEANNFEAYMQGQDGLCPQCWGKEQKLKKEQEKEELKEKVNNKLADNNIILPELTGSEKQIKWGNDIRNRFVEQLTILGFRWDIIASGGYPENLKPEVNKLFESSAKVWIESRGKIIFNIYVE